MSRRRYACALLVIAGELGLVSGLVACGPLGLAPRPRTGRSHSLSGQRRLTDLPDEEPAGGADPKRIYRIGEREHAQLQQSLCRFDPGSPRAARLARRGFTLAEILQACRDLRRYAGGDQQFLEHIAAWRRAGLAMARFRRFQRSGLSLTDYYNQRRIGGPRLTVAGTALMIAGATLLAGSLTIALVVVPAYLIHRALNDESDVEPGATRLVVAFGALMGLGTLSTLAGIPLVALGKIKYRSWLRGELLDVGHVDDLDRFRLRYLEPSRGPVVSASLAPLVTRGGGGLSFRLQW